MLRCHDTHLEARGSRISPLAKRLNQVVKIQIDGQCRPLLVRIINVDGLLIGVEHKHTPVLFGGMVVHKREQVVVVLVECSILANQRRRDVPDAPPDSHLQNPPKYGIGWGTGIPEVECAFFQKQLLALQGLLIRVALDVLDLHNAVGFGLRVHRLVYAVTLGIDLLVPGHIVIEWVWFAVDNRRNIERDFAGFGELDVQLEIVDTGDDTDHLVAKGLQHKLGRLRQTINVKLQFGVIKIHFSLPLSCDVIEQPPGNSQRSLTGHSQVVITMDKPEEI